MLRKISVVLALCALLAPAWAAAQVTTFKIDPVHSQVQFTVRHFVSRVTGSFDKFEGTIMVDPKDPSTMSVTGKVKTASVDTHNERRDGHLKSPDFFNAATDSELTFQSKKVTKNGDHWTVLGDLTMRGVTKEVPFDVAILGFMDAMGGTRAGLTATTKVNRKDFGINWNKVLDNGGTMLSDDVDITLNIEAATERQAPPPATASGNKK